MAVDWQSPKGKNKNDEYKELKLFQPHQQLWKCNTIF